MLGWDNQPSVQLMNWCLQYMYEFIEANKHNETSIENNLMA